MQTKNKPLRPIDGAYRNTEKQRKKACKAAGHPAIYVNCSLSGKEGVEVRRCYCGKREERG